MEYFSAEALRKARLMKRVTQAELGLEVGLSAASVCRIERGDRLPSAAEMVSIKRALGSMEMKKVTIPEREFSVATRLAGGQHRIKIEIRLERFVEEARHIGPQMACRPTSSKPGEPIAFYISLDGLAIESPEDANKEEELTNRLRPRQR